MKRINMQRVRELAASFISKVAAACRALIEWANERADQKLAAQEAPQAYAAYEQYAGALKSALDNCAESLHIYQLRDAEALLSENGPVRRGTNNWIFPYKILYNPGFGVTAGQMQKVIQTEMNSICKYHGLPRVRVFVQLSTQDYRGQVVLSYV